MRKIFMLGLLMVSLCCSHAQDLSELWKNTLESFSSDDIMQIFVVQADSHKKLPKKFVSDILKAMKEIEVLESPDCRCLPQTTGSLVFFLRENRIFTIELVKEHWFQANLLLQGRSIRFILKDKKDTLPEKVMNILNPPQKPVKPEKSEKPEIKTPEPEKQTSMCEECSQMMFMMAIGTCECCGATTSSISFKYCKACALKKGVCQVCEKKVK